MDVWLLPFLNVFGLVGTIDGSTEVDFSDVPLPFPLGKLAIDLRRHGLRRRADARGGR